MKQTTAALLWDLDGTIIDTEESQFESWSIILQHYGHDLERDVFDANFGRNNKAILPVFLGVEPSPLLYDQIVTEKEKIFREIASQKAALVSGVESWLSLAKEIGLVQAVASSASMENITTLLSAFSLLDYFDVLVAGENLPAKPEPDIFLEAAKQLNIPPEKCIVIEDSAAGVQAAKQAGMTCVAVITSHSKSQLASADVIVQDFKQSLALLLSDLLQENKSQNNK